MARRLPDCVELESASERVPRCRPARPVQAPPSQHRTAAFPATKALWGGPCWVSEQRMLPGPVCQGVLGCWSFAPVHAWRLWSAALCARPAYSAAPALYACMSEHAPSPCGMYLRAGHYQLRDGCPPGSLRPDQCRLLGEAEELAAVCDVIHACHGL